MTKNQQWYKVGVVKIPNHQWVKEGRDKVGNLIHRCQQCDIRKIDNCSTYWQMAKWHKWIDIKEMDLPSCVEPLKTMDNSLGLAVNGCKKSPNKKHMPSMSTVTGHILDPGEETEMYVIDADCVYCGLSGSRQVNPYSFNWD